MRAAFAEGHAEAHRVARLAALGAGPHQEQHGANVLPWMLGKMTGVVDAAEAGMNLLAIQSAPEQPLLKCFVILRFLGAGGEVLARESKRYGEGGRQGASMQARVHRRPVQISHDLHDYNPG
jgi:hypothetical protein